ncbi:MAG: aminotransferase class I/II-fold pyridoxal phosphate-dependent enzyme [Chloroflexi bacterium]|nr:aminotransferase class I/II-fold pyridoxal phosphate-dependent enzyme [Chloroflexota bacterium]
MGEVNDALRTFPDIINLGLGDPDFITDDVIINNACLDAKAGHTRYTDYRGDPELRKEISGFYENEYNLAIGDDEIFITTGGCHAMYLALEAILNDGDEVLVQSPCFTPYPDQVRLARGVPIEVPTYEENRFQLREDVLAGLITEKTRALIINTPNNPTGSCFSLDTLQMIARFANDHDLIVIADDIYTSYSYENPFVPIISLPGMRERTITINSFSKNFIMTGWRIGNIVAPAELVRVIQHINENVVFTVPSISQRAAIHALRNRQIQDSVLETYKNRTSQLAKQINSTPNMSVITPHMGTFYLFINIRKTGLSSNEVSKRILNEAHVLVLPGVDFGKCGEGYIRVSCTVSQDNLTEAFERIGYMDIFS